MKRFAFRIFAFFFALLLSLLFAIPHGATAGALAAKEAPFEIRAKSAVLMEVKTGQILFSVNEAEALPPASVTKVMTLLLLAEAIDGGKISLDDPVSVSERAASMGGSQIFLEAGEQMRVEDLFKSVVMASANDAALALAEHLCGSEDAFVAKMNARARELGMENTHFENTNGLDDTTTAHLTSAMDIAIMSRELLSHSFILKYTTLWQDTVRDGAFTLTNTNRLVRFYPGCTGLKTGSTDKAGFCVSASAERNGMHLVCVIMGAESRDIRNEEAKKLLDFGFSNFSVYEDGGIAIPNVAVAGGVALECRVYYTPWRGAVEKGTEGRITVSYTVAGDLHAPVHSGDEVGRVIYALDGRTLHEEPIYANGDVEKIGFWDVFREILRAVVGCRNTSEK